VAILEAQDLAVTFGGLRALDGVDLRLDAGELVGVIGPNGAGKSTLFGAIIGLIVPSRGEVLLDGQRITGSPSYRCVQQGLAKTSQLVQVFGEMSALENVTMGVLCRTSDLHTAQSEARDVLDFVGLAAIADVQATQLPLATRAQLELARAIATRPRVLMVDELMAGLNDAEVSRTIVILQKVRDELGTTLLVIEHNMRAIMRLCERIVVLADGRILADGPPEAISRDQKVLDVYLGVG
jgi:branched-chain amino acid transport system ATP-binding protein